MDRLTWISHRKMLSLRMLSIDWRIVVPSSIAIKQVKMNRIELMRQAIAEARKGIHAGHGGPFGTVIVKDGKVVGRGHNCVLSLNDPTCHGEVAAIRDAGKKLGTFDLSGCELYTPANHATCAYVPACGPISARSTMAALSKTTAS